MPMMESACLPGSFVMGKGTFARKGDGFWANVAQLVAHILGKDEVGGSIPLVGSIFPSDGPGSRGNNSQE